jgi:hypothetical protein
MKESYDFSQGQRGKFYTPDAQFELPIYLESDLVATLQKIADAQGSDIQTIANNWIRQTITSIESSA